MAKKAAADQSGHKQDDQKEVELRVAIPETLTEFTAQLKEGAKGKLPNFVHEEIPDLTAGTQIAVHINVTINRKNKE